MHVKVLSQACQYITEQLVWPAAAYAMRTYSACAASCGPAHNNYSLRAHQRVHMGGTVFIIHAVMNTRPFKRKSPFVLLNKQSLCSPVSLDWNSKVHIIYCCIMDDVRVCTSAHS